METETKLETTKENDSIKNKLSIPMAIVVAGVIIAGAIYFSSITPTAKIEQKPENLLENVEPITEIDHIRGNINAPIKIVEYSDTECPFCKMFHATMKQIIDEYGENVAWIYRHSPIDGLHPKARKEAEATECANELGGNNKFWEYIDRIYEVTPSNNGLDPKELSNIALYIGLNVTDFNNCLNNNKYEQHIDKDLQNANATGGGGTPWSILIAKDNTKYPINGALPYSKIKELIDFALK